MVQKTIFHSHSLHVSSSLALITSLVPSSNTHTLVQKFICSRRFAWMRSIEAHSPVAQVLLDVWRSFRLLWIRLYRNSFSAHVIALSCKKSLSNKWQQNLNKNSKSVWIRCTYRGAYTPVLSDCFGLPSSLIASSYLMKPRHHITSAPLSPCVFSVRIDYTPDTNRHLADLSISTNDFFGLDLKWQFTADVNRQKKEKKRNKPVLRI